MVARVENDALEQRVALARREQEAAEARIARLEAERDAEVGETARLNRSRRAALSRSIASSEALIARLQDAGAAGNEDREERVLELRHEIELARSEMAAIDGAEREEASEWRRMIRGDEAGSGGPPERGGARQRRDRDDAADTGGHRRRDRRGARGRRNVSASGRRDLPDDQPRVGTLRQRLLHGGRGRAHRAGNAGAGLAEHARTAGGREPAGHGERRVAVSTVGRRVEDAARQRAAGRALLALGSAAGGRDRAVETARRGVRVDDGPRRAAGRSSPACS